jgi:Pyruvate/2-oxoacid:ferredoxin oxidoreductase gamma subunit
MGGRINTIMQTCFFAISGVLPREQAIAQIKHAIEKTYSKRGAEVVKRNFEAVDATLSLTCRRCRSRRPSPPRTAVRRWCLRWRPLSYSE